jgi:drug/metabolite transporter (DMT)-like permease
MQVVFFPVLGIFIFIFPWMVFKGIPTKGKEPGFLLLRALAGFFFLALFFYALQRIPVGSAISIRYVSPIFASLFA